MALVQLLSWLCHCLGHAHTSMEQLGNDHTVTAVAIEVFLECCINSFANMNQFI